MTNNYELIKLINKTKLSTKIIIENDHYYLI
jgi:hypothetical protein